MECIPMCLANFHYDLKEQMSNNQYDSHGIRHALKRCIKKSHNYICFPYASSSALGQVMPSELDTYFMNTLLLIPSNLHLQILKCFEQLL